MQQLTRYVFAAHEFMTGHNAREKEREHVLATVTVPSTSKQQAWRVAPTMLEEKLGRSGFGIHFLGIEER